MNTVTPRPVVACISGERSCNVIGQRPGLARQDCSPPTGIGGIAGQPCGVGTSGCVEPQSQTGVAAKIGTPRPLSSLRWVLIKLTIRGTGPLAGRRLLSSSSSSSSDLPFSGIDEDPAPGGCVPVLSAKWKKPITVVACPSSPELNRYLPIGLLRSSFATRSCIGGDGGSSTGRRVSASVKELRLNCCPTRKSLSFCRFKELIIVCLLEVGGSPDTIGMSEPNVKVTWFSFQKMLCINLRIPFIFTSMPICQHF